MTEYESETIRLILGVALVADVVYHRQMTDIVNVHQAKTHLSRLLDRAAAGEVIIIAKAGKPVARLTGLDPSAGLGPRQPGMFPRLQVPDSFFEPLPDEE